MVRWTNLWLTVVVVTLILAIFTANRFRVNDLKTPNGEDHLIPSAKSRASNGKDYLIPPVKSRNGVQPVQEKSPKSFITIEQSDRFRRNNRGIAKYPDAFEALMADFVKRKVSARDEELVKFVRDLFDPPSTINMLKLSHGLKSTPQADEILKILEKKRGGFFVECGALDGERSSNTMYLEKRFGWSGLLIEMDPHFYSQLLGKSRQSWSLNACLSLSQHPTQMSFLGSSGGMGRLDTEQSSQDSGSTVPCFPLETVLLAINHTHVDYFSLDVEGFELDILKTIPFDRVTIETLSVEYRHGGSGKQMILDFMRDRGYNMEKDISVDNPAATLFVKDFIFVRNPSNRSA